MGPACLKKPCYGGPDQGMREQREVTSYKASTKQQRDRKKKPKDLISCPLRAETSNRTPTKS